MHTAIRGSGNVAHYFDGPDQPNFEIRDTIVLCLHNEEGQKLDLKINSRFLSCQKDVNVQGDLLLHFAVVDTVTTSLYFQPLSSDWPVSAEP